MGYIRLRRENKQQVGQGRGRGFVAGDQQRAHERDGFLEGQRRAVFQPRVHDVGNHVLARFGFAFAHTRDQMVLQFANIACMFQHLLAVLHASDLLRDRMRPALNFV